MYLDRYREQILQWLGQGLTDRAIAERLRVSASTVRYWRSRNGVARTPGPIQAGAVARADANPAADGGA